MWLSVGIGVTTFPQWATAMTHLYAMLRATQSARYRSICPIASYKEASRFILNIWKGAQKAIRDYAIQSFHLLREMHSPPFVSPVGEVTFFNEASIQMLAPLIYTVCNKVDPLTRALDEGNIASESIYMYDARLSPCIISAFDTDVFSRHGYFAKLSLLTQTPPTLIKLG